MRLDADVVPAYDKCHTERGYFMARNMSPVAELLRDALKAVEDAQIPEDLRVMAFSKAFDSLSGGLPAPSATSGSPAVPTATMDSRIGSELGLIAEKLAIDAEATEATFDLDEGQLRLTVPARKFNAQKSRATKEIALLVAAGRQAAKLDERTEVRVIREVVSEYGKLDSANFAATVREMDEEFIISGSGQQRRVKVNRAGFERAAELIKEIHAW
jgi:hypothetical protein